MTDARTTFAALVDRVDAVMFDAYGVLVDAGAAIDGAREALEYLAARATPYLVLSNDASRLPDTMARRFRDFGLDIAPDRILSSGEVLTSWVSRHGLRAPRCIVLGTDDSRTYVARAGGQVVEADAPGDVDVVVVCDEHGYPFLETLDATVTSLYREISSGRTPRIVLPNPDCVYPKGAHTVGVAAGAVAAMITSALSARFGDDRVPVVEPLGKPHAWLFDEGCRRLGTRNVAMLGDQLHTDIVGANQAGLVSVLVETGVSRAADANARGALEQPTFVLHSLDVG